MKKIQIPIFILIAIIIDQITKYFVLKNEVAITVIPKLLNFSLVKNYGAAFGMMQGANTVLAIISIIICLLVIIAVAYFNKKRRFPFLWVFFNSIWWYWQFN